MNIIGNVIAVIQVVHGMNSQTIRHLYGSSSYKRDKDYVDFIQAVAWFAHQISSPLEYLLGNIDADIRRSSEMSSMVTKPPKSLSDAMFSSLLSSLRGSGLVISRGASRARLMTDSNESISSQNGSLSGKSTAHKPVPEIKAVNVVSPVATKISPRPPTWSPAKSSDSVKSKSFGIAAPRLKNDDKPSILPGAATSSLSIDTSVIALDYDDPIEITADFNSDIDNDAKSSSNRESNDDIEDHNLSVHLLDINRDIETSERRQLTERCTSLQNENQLLRDEIERLKSYYNDKLSNKLASPATTSNIDITPVLSNDSTMTQADSLSTSNDQLPSSSVESISREISPANKPMSPTVSIDDTSKLQQVNEVPIDSATYFHSADENASSNKTDILIKDTVEDIQTTDNIEDSDIKSNLNQNTEYDDKDFEVEVNVLDKNKEDESTDNNGEYDNDYESDINVADYAKVNDTEYDNDFLNEVETGFDDENAKQVDLGVVSATDSRNNDKDYEHMSELNSIDDGVELHKDSIMIDNDSASEVYSVDSKAYLNPNQNEIDYVE